MTPVFFRKAHRIDFQGIVRLIAKENEIPERQCIHSSIGDSPESILREMLKWDEIGEVSFVIALQDGRLVGVMGSEFDEELGRGWLWGPFALVQDWEALADSLYEELFQILPASIRQFGAFLNAANQRGVSFYLQRGFERHGVSHVYQAARPAMSVPVQEPCPALKSEHKEGFTALHTSIFPNAYYSAQRVLDQIDEDNQVFVFPQGERVLGYVYATVGSDVQSGEVEFLGVHEDARRRGIGRQLLLSALQWLFEVKGVSPVVLTVYDENNSARSLYEGAGFDLKYTGVGLDLADTRGDVTNG